MMKSLFFRPIFIIIIALIVLSCSDDDEHVTEVRPLELTIGLPHTSEAITNTPWTYEGYTLINNYVQYDIDNITINLADNPSIPFSLNNDSFGDFDLLIDYIRKDGQDLNFSTPEEREMITEMLISAYSINDQFLLQPHPVHPSNGILIDLLPNDNEFSLSFLQVGDYEFGLSLQTEALSNNQRLIHRSKITFSYTVNP